LAVAPQHKATFDFAVVLELQATLFCFTLGRHVAPIIFGLGSCFLRGEGFLLVEHERWNCCRADSCGKLAPIHTPQALTTEDVDDLGKPSHLLKRTV
jgi:hypothetical protein